MLPIPTAIKTAPTSHNNRNLFIGHSLAFEGAGGAGGEFDGVFGAGFFGVLFEG